ncbi:MAG: CpaF family protein [Thermosipho sp. (in: Bacteria)]|nr:CpaF family protein [Thermosipho sp. (in: thermotogales)]
MARIGKRHLFEATKFVQDIITDPDAFGQDIAAEHQQILDAAQAGDVRAIKITQKIIANILSNYGVEVDGYTMEELAYNIYSYAWGLDVIEDYYWDDEIDEIRVNSPKDVFVQRRGKNERVNVQFKDEEHVKKILSRLFIHDRGVSLTSSTPVVESIRLDGTRVTATCPPATSSHTFVLRKKTFVPTAQKLIEAETVSPQLLDLLAYLVNGRANILISGGTGTGKTTFLRFLVRYMDERLRIVTLESDRELELRDIYPDRDIVEMEEHPEIGLTMDKQFRTVLRYSPDVILVGEFRGRGEATNAVKACVRGHNGSMATAHFGSPQEAIEGTAKMMLEEGLNLPLDVAQLWVASAFQIVIQMFSDSRRGIKKVTKVTEVSTRFNKVHYTDLAVWVPSSDDFFKGHWEFPNPISTKLLDHMAQFNPDPELLEKVLKLT